MFIKGKHVTSSTQSFKRATSGRVEQTAKAANEASSALLKFLIAGGGLLTFIYCFFYIKFFPTGLTTGDTLFFLWALIGFTFAHVLLLAFCWYATGWLATLLARLVGTTELPKSKAWRKPGEKLIRFAVRKISEYFDFGLSALFSLLCLSLLIYLGFAYYSSAVVMASTGFLLGSLFESRKRWRTLSGANKWAFLGICLLAVIVPLVLDSKIREKEIEIVFDGLGVRSAQSSIRLSEENFSLLRSVAQQYHVPIFPCGIEGGNKERMVSGVDVLWHGIGERSLVAIPLNFETSNSGPPSKPSESSANHLSVRLELQREGMHVVRSDRPGIERCIDISGDVLFPSGSDALLPGSEGEIVERVGQMLDSRGVILRRLRVVGHADIQPVVTRGQTNHSLAMSRAERVRQILIKVFEIAPDTVIAESKGASEPRVQCPPNLPLGMMSECLSPNRRVEIRGEFLLAKSNPVPEHKSADRGQ
jgi:outer membrane protein OmpA-like peptidoglycan-associated protein